MSDARVIELDARRPIPCPHCFRDIPRPLFVGHRLERIDRSRAVETRSAS